MTELTTRTHKTPVTELDPGERVETSFAGDRGAYWRDHAWMAAMAMALGMGVLWALGNPHVWTGAVGGLLAISVRAFYLASDDIGARWDLTDRRLLGPGTRAILLGNITQVRTIFSAVQIVTVSGDKHLMKYMAEPQRVVAEIEAARARAPRGGEA